MGSTERAAAEGDERWAQLIGGHDRDLRRQLERFGGHHIRSTGDGFLALFDGPARAIRCGEAIHEVADRHGLSVRMGVHTGEVELHEDGVAGIAVHLCARVTDAAGPGELLVSGAVPPLVVGSGIEFADRGHHDLPGVPGQWQLFAVSGT